MGEERDEELEELLVYLRDSRGFDFTGYKRPTLTRRVQRRLQELGIDSYQAYREELEVHPDEFVALFNTILINVTQFFRDEEAWRTLAEQVVPTIVGPRGSVEPVRVWSAACASGPEAYTLAMILAEAMDREEFLHRVKIYGTDVDDEDLETARQATYGEAELRHLPDGYRERYFDEVEDGAYVFDRDLRRSVIFGRHDLVRDAPISRLDLLTCRNTLMYFKADVQDEILHRFHFALRPGGHLFLGKAETLLTHSDLYEPVDMAHRIFAKGDGGERRRPLSLRGARRSRAHDLAEGTHVELVVDAFGAVPVPHVVISDGGVLVAANDAARQQFALREADVGRPFHDLELSYKPTDLRSLIDRAVQDGSLQRVRSVERSHPDGQAVWFDVEVVPLRDGGQDHRGVSITFRDVTRHRRLEEELQSTNAELQAASEELQSTNEELETTNEELQSSNEELETTNEELQSTNEELGTMNAELQSANAELQAINDELEERTGQLDDASAFLRSILRGLRGTVVVLDEQLLVRTWSERAEDLWGLRPAEVQGRNFLGLDFGLPVEQLRAPIKSCLEDGEAICELDLAAYDRRGRPVTCHVTSTPLVGPAGDVRGCILLMENDVTS